jgi:hypothetical protein
MAKSSHYNKFVTEVNKMHDNGYGASQLLENDTLAESNNY